MARSPCFLFFFALVVLATSAAQSVAFPSVKSFANTTSFSSGTITSMTSLTASSLTNLTNNTNCLSCVIAADQIGLQQVFWFTEAWSVTLDTEYITVTSFNGSNVTATTNTRTVLGDVQSLNTSNIPYIETLMATIYNGEGYFNARPTIVRGTNGSVGTTSFPYGQPYAEVTAIDYRSMLPSPDCPRNMGKARFNTKEDECLCLMNTFFPLAGDIVTNVKDQFYTMTRTYYVPLPSTQINETNAGNIFDMGSLQHWDGAAFKAWLAEDEAFKSAFPNWEDCAFWNAAAGPPAAKIPVAALTATISTTVNVAVASSSPPPKPVAQPQPPISMPTFPAVSTPATVPTAQPKVSQSGSGSGGDSGGSGIGGSESSGSQPPPLIPKPTTNAVPAVAPVSIAQPKAGQSNSGSGGEPGSGSGESASLGSHGGSGSSTESGNSVPQSSQGAGGSSGNSGNSGPTGSGGDTGMQGSGSGATGNGGHSSQGGGGSTGGANGQGGGQTGSFGLSGPSGTVSGSGLPGSNTPPPTVPFVVTAGGQTVSGTVHGSTAAVVAGTTLFAGGPPSSAGGALISIHPSASSIAINGESQPLPTAEPAPAAATLPAPIATVGSHTMTASPGASEVYYAGTTLSQNGPHATIDNTEVYVGSSGLVIGGSSTVAIPAAPSSGSGSEGVASAMTFTAAGRTLTSYPSGIAVAGTTIQPGSQVVVSGTTISYGSSGLAIGTSIVPIPTTPPPSAGSESSPGAVPANVFTLGGQTLTAKSNGIYIAGSTLSANGPPITIQGTPVSLGPSGLIIASSTYAIPSGALPTNTFTLGGQTFTANPTAIEIAGTTLTPGSPALTISGTPISLGSSGLVVASSTYALPSGASPPSTTVIASQTFTLHPTFIEIAGTTLTPNSPALTIHGTPISLNPSSSLIIAGSTYTFPSPLSTTTTSEGGLGSAILAGFGPSTTVTATGGGGGTTSSVVAFQGGATRLGGWRGGMGIVALLVGTWIAFCV